MTELLNAYKHEKQVRQFLSSKHIAESYIHYDNLKLYANAKQTVTLNIVSESDKKILNKFIKNWVITKGDVKPNYIKRVSGMIKHYAYKTQNLALRNARLQRKKPLKLNMA